MNSSPVLLLLLMLISACRPPGSLHRPQYTAFTGATLIDGNGGSPITDAVLVIRDGRVYAAGAAQSTAIPDRSTVIDVSGKTIIPGIINAHGHVGNTKGIEGGHYSRENVIDNLRIYARYGVTTVVSLGDDQAAAVPLRAVSDTLPAGRARLFIAGDVISGETVEDALSVAERNHEMGVDFLKIRVDDNLGTGVKIPPEIWHAVIDRAHELGYKIATHMYYLEDARALLEAGSDMLAHSVRDQEVDEEFLRLIRAKNVPYCPTLTRELSTFVYGDTVAFFEDPFFTREYDQSLIGPLKDPARQREVRESKGAQTYRRQLPVAMKNLKKLSDAGVPIVFGTDSGVPTRFMGYFEHLEMEMMAEAGLTPMQILISASRNPAQYMGLPDLGTLSAGHWADFIVLDANPMDDIKNVRQISAVYIGGEKVPR